VKILITRTDKLGDLVLSIPVFEYLRGAIPELEIHALVAPISVPLLENNPHLAGIWTWDEADSQDTLLRLENRLRGEGFDAAIMLQYRRELAQLLRRAGIGRRHGPWSRLSSWFLLNKGTWQGRSHSNLHEMEQNLHLARHFLGRRAQGVDFPQPTLYLTEGQRDVGSEFRSDFVVGSDKVVFVHPGSGGSALDWAPSRFAVVANTLASMDGFRVFITGAAGDASRVTQVSAGLDQDVAVLLDRYNLRDFLGVLSAGDYFVGPSTGPLHLAAALGLGTVGLYPPVPTMSPGRWGPRGVFTQTVVPAVDCPARRLCSMERCPHYNCMDGVYERDVLGAVMEVHRLKTEAPLAGDVVQEEES
jgi:heptosyltransferase III